MSRVVINRYQESETATHGNLIVLDGDEVVYSCDTLELPYLENKRRISSVLPGTYEATKRLTPHSAFAYEHIHVLEVPWRNWILIHRGNRPEHTKGCILVGDRLDDQLVNSKEALDKLLEVLPDQFDVTILKTPETVV